MSDRDIGRLVNDMNRLCELRSLLMRAWTKKQTIIIIPEAVDELQVILRDERRVVIEHSRTELPDAQSLIAALVEGLEKALREVERG